MTRTRGARLAQVLSTAGLLLAAVFAPGIARADNANRYQQHNLVSDLPGMAQFQDSNLVNSWGIAHSPTGPWFVADNGTGVATAYFGNGEAFQMNGTPLVITIPPPSGVSGMAAPTGTVFNPNPSEFRLSQDEKSGAQFLFATEDGTISGWNPNVDPTHAILKVDRSQIRVRGDLGAVYKGLAFGSNDDGDFIYATNFRFGMVEQFNAQFQLVRSFTDPALANDCPVKGSPKQCFAPFGIQNVGGKLFVTYALQNKAEHDDVSGPGNGFIDVFDTEGQLLQRFASQGTLNSPWGVALAPAHFGAFSNHLLIGNFGDGRINAFDLQTGAFDGQLADTAGNPISIDDLWGIAFGNGGLAGQRDELFFAAGIGDEMHGLFGKIVSQN
jgi:uncharacterized protein (TIGR03118 family)